MSASSLNSLLSRSRKSRPAKVGARAGAEAEVDVDGKVDVEVEVEIDVAVEFGAIAEVLVVTKRSIEPLAGMPPD